MIWKLIGLVAGFAFAEHTRTCLIVGWDVTCVRTGAMVNQERVLNALGMAAFGDKAVQGDPEDQGVVRQLMTHIFSGRIEVATNSQLRKRFKRRLSDWVEHFHQTQAETSSSSEVLAFRNANLSVIYAALSVLAPYSKMPMSTADLEPEHLSQLETDIIPPSEGGEMLEALLEFVPCKAHMERGLQRYSNLGVPGAVFSHGFSIADQVLAKNDPAWFGYAKSSADPGAAYQWYLGNFKWHIHFLDAWKYIQHMSSVQPVTVPVVVVDSGCADNHPDMNYFETTTSRCRGPCRGWDASGEDGDFSTGAQLHGTMVMGLIGARSNNAMGLVGACPQCKVHCIRVSTSTGSIFTSALLRAYDYILENVDKFPISNHSYGGYTRLRSEKAALKKLSDRGHVIVAAAGNGYCNLDSGDCEFVSPAMYDVPTLVSVGASDLDGNMAEFSNRGRSIVDVWAPGVNIPTFSDGENPNLLSFANGTSFSAPITTAALALTMGWFPNIDPNLRIRLLRLSSTQPTFGFKNSTSGYINLHRMLAYMAAISSMYAKNSATH
ncbi:MAG: uncharacterized protein KVP18_004598 [Porospora cf. gigantea A]|uniref:uncharacterized protein n=1 Tax=Porospora cf. gigantea A TaxID=2853593 RepID=UPI00355A76EB|nr:MAG: hypothetical protein KVP18_004598 [Porospora cf. gigantea A]